MAKMFYTIEEAAQRLGKSADEVQGMANTGQLQEFRDRDKLMFKREQVDLLAGDDPKGKSRSGTGIPLADSKGGSGLTLSLEDDEPASSPRGKQKKGDSSMGIELDSPKERSGISIFDADNTDDTDPLAATAITGGIRKGVPEGGLDQGELTALESGGSGSGLLDLTREADDTSLGADLLEDVYKPDDEGGGETQGASGLFETTSAPSDMSASAAPAMAMMVAEAYDGAGSGLVGGLALGSALVVLISLLAVLMGILGAGDNSIVSLLAGNIWAAIGALALVVAICGGIGWFLGKRS